MTAGLSICCRACLRVEHDVDEGQELCRPCLGERERIRKLRWAFKRMPTRARAARYRQKKTEDTGRAA